MTPTKPRLTQIASMAAAAIYNVYHVAEMGWMVSTVIMHRLDAICIDTVNKVLNGYE